MTPLQYLLLALIALLLIGWAIYKLRDALKKVNQVLKENR
jgi:hypothetical protein